MSDIFHVDFIWVYTIITGMQFNNDLEDTGTLVPFCSIL